MNRKSGNYICDEDTYPQQVQFANGRVVSIRFTLEGRPYLDVRWSKKEPTDTFVETILAMSDTEVLLQAIWEYGSPKAAMDVAKRTQKVIEGAIKSVRANSITGGPQDGETRLEASHERKDQ